MSLFDVYLRIILLIRHGIAIALGTLISSSTLPFSFDVTRACTLRKSGNELFTLCSISSKTNAVNLT